jgi:hypothetical protein
MSFDPFGQQQPNPPAQPAPTPGVSPAPAAPADPAAAARDRVAIPAMVLVATAAFNLIWAVLLFLGAFSFSRMPPDQLEEALARQHPARYAEMQQAGYTVEDMLRIYVGVFIGAGITATLASLLGIVGGVCMLSLRGYGLAVFASLLTAIPCVSPMSCPCLFIGTLVGFWCIAVLLNADVRAGFR